MGLAPDLKQIEYKVVKIVTVDRTSQKVDCRAFLGIDYTETSGEKGSLDDAIPFTYSAEKTANDGEIVVTHEWSRYSLVGVNGRLCILKT